MRTVKLISAFFLTATVMLLAGCGGSPFAPTTIAPPNQPTETTTPIPFPGPKSGYWSGEWEDGEVSFILTEENAITDFMITIRGCSIYLGSQIQLIPNEEFGSISFNPDGELLGSANRDTDFSAEATFISETRLSGTYSVIKCGTSALFGSRDISWVAEWQEE
ncbi:MAG: hypothetical protein PVF70_06700 [Anaerolineales bacterium]